TSRRSSCPTRSVATGYGATATECRRPTNHYTSTPPAGGWSSVTSRCPTICPNLPATTRSHSTSPTTSTISGSQTASGSAQESPTSNPTPTEPSKSPSPPERPDGTTRSWWPTATIGTHGFPSRCFPVRSPSPAN